MNLITYRAFIREKKAELIRLFSAAYQKEIDFDFADWHLNKLLTVQDDRICCEEPTGRAVYISYLEKNFHFSAFPTRPMFIGGNRDLKLYFTGEVEGDLVVDLCVITYDEQNKLSVERTAINKCRIVRLPEEARYIRISRLPPPSRRPVWIFWKTSRPASRFRRTSPILKSPAFLTNSRMSAIATCAS